MIINMLNQNFTFSFKSVLNETSIKFAFTHGAQRVVKCRKCFATFSNRWQIKTEGYARFCTRVCKICKSMKNKEFVSCQYYTLLQALFPDMVYIQQVFVC